MALTLLVLCVVANLVGDVLLKEWSSPTGPSWLLFLGVAVYVGDALLWAGSLRHGIDLSRGLTLFSTLALLGGVFIGYCYGERLSPTNWLGVLFAILAIVCVQHRVA